MAKKKTDRKPRQQHLPTLEPPSIPEIDQLADKYVAVRDERMRLNDDEVAKRDLLQLKMKEHGLKQYEYDGKVIEIVAEEKVKVKRKKGEEAGDGDD